MLIVITGFDSGMEPVEVMRISLKDDSGLGDKAANVLSASASLEVHDLHTNSHCRHGEMVEGASSPTVKPAMVLPLPAFPGAEGFGTNAVGGRGGRVIEVTNLKDSGPGSLRAAIEVDGPRIVVFRTGGTVELQSGLEVTNPFITIAGQTAPGGGITLKNHSSNDETPLMILTHDVIVRYVRVRPGPGGQPDGILIYQNGAHNVILDHCSISWAVDENIGTWGDPYDITIQWSIISEGLFDSTHPEGPHSMGMLLGSNGSHNISVHHNLFIHNSERNPRIRTSGLVDVVNNVVYNYGIDAARLSNHDSNLPVNCVANYVKRGADSKLSSYEVELSPPTGSFTYSVFVKGNIGPHRPTDGLDEALVVAPEDRGSVVPGRHEAPTVTTTSAFTAYDQILDGAGATIGLDSQGNSFWRRDAVDERIVNDVRNGTGGIIDDPSDVGGWPELAAGIAPRDSDHDGMPDDWEGMWGFHPCNAADGSGDADGDGYTNVEEYLNGTDPGHGTATVPGCFFLFLPIVVKSRPVPEDMSRGWQ
jgi:pectate lyase